MKRIEHVAMNIVYQLGDLYELSVEKRQATNDEAVDFVEKVIKDYIENL